MLFQVIYGIEQNQGTKNKTNKVNIITQLSFFRSCSFRRFLWIKQKMCVKGDFSKSINFFLFRIFIYKESEKLGVRGT